MQLCHFLKAEHALATLRNQRLKVATIRDLNDPFELMCADMPTVEFRRSFAAFKTWAANNFGILCFTKRWKNPLMWSHYGDRHHGVVLEFDVDEEALIRVRYSRKRISFDLSKVELVNGFSSRDAELIARTKSHHWSYEKECRVAVALKECTRVDNLYFQPLSSRLRIAGVIAGPLCNVDVDAVASNLPHGMTVRYQRARLAFRSFNVVRRLDIPPIEVRGIRLASTSEQSES